MPTTPAQKHDTEILKELQRLNESVELIIIDLERIAPSNKRQKAVQLIGEGILRGLGFVLGTTVIAALLLLALAGIVQSEFFQTWFSSQTQELLTEIIPTREELLQNR